MNKIFQYLPPILISALVVKSFITPSISDAVSIMALSAIYGLFVYIDFIREPEVNSDVKARLVAAEAELKRLSDKVSAVQFTSRFK